MFMCPIIHETTCTCTVNMATSIICHENYSSNSVIEINLLVAVCTVHCEFIGPNCMLGSVCS